MRINEIERISGLSKKTIRYYEKVGLLSPKRTLNNDYRFFTQDDMNELKKIKLLRELDVPIQEIKQLQSNKISLKDCMNKRFQKIEEYKKNYQKISQICKEIATSNLEYQNLETENYTIKINQLKRKGFSLNHNQTHTKKITGAIISSLIFIIFFATIIGFLIYFQQTETEQIPIIIFLFIIAILILPMISIMINLFIRIKEIKGGEEDEASKY